MEFFSSLFYFGIVIGILVFIHELGHFLAARLSGMRTDTFAFGMGPRLFGYNRINGFTFGKLPDNWEGNGHCDYRFCAFPIGGYVKVAGMVDESMDTEFAKSEPKEWEFRSKNFLQKLFTLSAGVIMNVLLAIFIYFGINLVEGKTIIHTTTVGYVEQNSIAEKIGLIEGDIILAVNDIAVNSWDDVLEFLALKNLGDSKTITVRRNGKNISLNADGKGLLKAVTGSIPLGLVPEKTIIVAGNVLTNSNAEKAGLQAGDTILTVNDEAITAFPKLTSILSKFKEKNVAIVVKRNNSKVELDALVDVTGKIGFAPLVIINAPRVKVDFGIVEAMTSAVERTYGFGLMFINSVKQIFKGNISAKESLGGPIMIAKSARDYAMFGLEAFLNFIAMLSITLAIINILPLPALDGGHIVFITIEAITRRELPLKLKIAVQNIGLVLLLALMAYVFYNDITRLF